MDALVEALQQGIAPAIVVGVYLIVQKIIDTSREKAKLKADNERDRNQIKVNSQIADSIDAIRDFVEGLTKNIIDKDREKSKLAIKTILYSSGMRILTFVTSTIVNNHLDTNKDTIITNIKNTLSSEWYDIYAELSMYTISDVRLSDTFDKEWVNEIEDDIIDIMYNKSLEKEVKISTFTNKLNIRLNSYINHMTTDIIKN